jgi:hypothetical protein
MSDTQQEQQDLYWHKQNAISSEEILKSVCERLGLTMDELRQLIKDIDEGRIH